MDTEVDPELESTNSDGLTVVQRRRALFRFAATPHVVHFAKERIDVVCAKVDKLAAGRAKKVLKAEHEVEAMDFVGTVPDGHVANAGAVSAGRATSGGAPTAVAPTTKAPVTHGAAAPSGIVLPVPGAASLDRLAVMGETYTE